MKNRICALLLTGTVGAGLVGCGLLPKEEEYPTVPVLSQAEIMEYDVVAVTRSDIQKIETVRISYQAPETEKYSFKFDNEEISQIYVEVGDIVKKGDVLAEVDITMQQEQVRMQQEAVDDLYLQLKHISETEEMSLREAKLQDQQAAEIGIDGWSSQAEAIASQYADQKRLIQQSIHLAEKKLEKAKEDMKARQIIAGMDGTITFLAELEEGESVSKGKAVAIIKDMSSARFEVDSQNIELLEDGKTYIAEIEKKEYEVLAEVSEGNNEEEESKVTLSLVTPEPNMETGVTGVIRFIVGESKGVLSVPDKAVYETEEGYVVYCVDELGFREKRTVEVGISDGTTVEILSGLEENELVILD